MAYLIFADRKGELARHELTGPIIIGRSPDCSIVVRDTQLSRRHCKVEQVLDQWVITDLDSKNGTRVDDRPVTRHTLEEGDVVQIGRMRVCFRNGAFIPAPPADRPVDVRPTDPLEALAGTVAGFRVPAEPTVDTRNFPFPQPQPAAPNTPSAAEAHSLITGLSSSGWDELISRSGGARTAPLPRVSVNVTSPAAAPTSRARTNRMLTLIGAAITLILVAALLLRHWM